MCGIAGFLALRHSLVSDAMRETVTRMTGSLAHRGPDDFGIWIEPTSGVALGHRRLAVLDVSPAGHQPMISHSGRFVITFNGEIYNFLDLRAELEQFGVGFRSQSDTEVVLAAFEQWGIAASIKRFLGMFAFAVWDRRDRKLTLARDRMGEKPLYYGTVDSTFLFGSELHAIRAHPAFDAEIDRDALALYLRHNCIPAPYSIYRGFKKLPPGTLLTMDGGEPQLSRYWHSKSVAERCAANAFRGSEGEAAERLEYLLRSAVKGQMISDVPLGVFLSGGIDSSTVVALMQTQSTCPVKTFTIGFSEPGYNEAEHAKLVANHLGTEHTELYVNSDEAWSVVPRLASMYDEPFSDSSQIPTYLVAALAREKVTVALSGDGGDELFGGYRRYLAYQRLWKKLRYLPGRRALARVLATKLSQVALSQLARPLLTTYSNQHRAAEDLEKFARMLNARSSAEMYLELVSHWKNPGDVVLRSYEPETIVENTSLWPRGLDFTRGMMYVDAVTYLPDDILAKIDRAAMGVSLETRIPLLDYRLVEFAWSLPISMKIRAGKGKWLLRQILYRYVPANIVERPKMGFAIPMHSWLRGPLRDWAESLLAESRLNSEGFFATRIVREKWERFLAGQDDHQFQLWDILMFQGWMREQQQPTASALQVTESMLTVRSSTSHPESTLSARSY
jgi:asparagine synthase (glutamine-hydrolysing)